jgi:prepilin-type N-terminal cleavage/methylation domain-containing protein
VQRQAAIRLALGGMAAPLPILGSMTVRSWPARGFSLVELLLVVAVASTLMAVSIPLMSNVTQSTKLNEAVRLVEREFQGARLKAVNVNRPLRVRLNCPSAGFLRTVEVTGTADDASASRCAVSAFPFPAADQDLMTKPNYDGPLQVLTQAATVTTRVFQFQPDGTTLNVVAGTPEIISTPVTITVTRNGQSKSVTVNGAGKIQQQ